ncbi:MAG TPA: dTMP kinase [Candidatus Thermoplasmatota archaeon]
MPQGGRRGALITVEGIDGTGKSSVASDLGRFLERKGVRAALQREPTSTWLGEAVRRGHAQGAAPLALTFLFLADRAEHARPIADQVAAGAVVVCDRFLDSTTAYQGAALAGVLPAEAGDPVEWVRQLQRPWAPVPDLTLLLVDDPAACMGRVRQRPGGTQLFEDAAFLSKVQANYRAIAAREPARFRVLEPGTLGDVQAAARAAVHGFLEARGLLPQA